MSARRAAPAAGVATLARRLVAVLRDESRLHDQLLHLTAAEREAIVAPAAPADDDGRRPLERIVADKEAAVARLGELEAIRVTLSGALAAAHGLPDATRLADLLPRLPPSIATLLQAERAALLDRAQALIEANGANRELLHGALATTRATLGYLRALQGHPYHRDGRAAHPAAGRRLNRLA